MMMMMSRRSPLWMLLGLYLVLVVLGDQQGPQNQTVQELTILPKQVSFQGTWSWRSPESEDVQAATFHAVDNFNNQSKAKKKFRLVSITSAQSQVTNVINFKLEAILGKTMCLKSDANHMEKCTLGKKRLGCRFDICFDFRKQIHKMDMSSCKKISSSSSPTSSSP